jgi:N-acetylmuramoyl-L-alanine amidase CwlA
MLMAIYYIPVENVIRHYDVTGKKCPEPYVRDSKAWEAFKLALGAEEVKLKPIEEVAKEVISGKWGNGSERKKRLAEAGYSYAEVQSKVNGILSGKKETALTKKSIEEIAREVINGKWGNGSARKKALEAAGYNYKEVQAKVNQILKK